MVSVYEAAGGDAGFLRLAAAWHERVLADEAQESAARIGARRRIDLAEIARRYPAALGRITLDDNRFVDLSSDPRFFADRDRTVVAMVLGLDVYETDVPPRAFDRVMEGCPGLRAR